MVSKTMRVTLFCAEVLILTIVLLCLFSKSLYTALSINPNFGGHVKEIELSQDIVVKEYENWGTAEQSSNNLVITKNTSILLTGMDTSSTIRGYYSDDRGNKCLFFVASSEISSLPEIEAYLSDLHNSMAMERDIAVKKTLCDLSLCFVISLIVSSLISLIVKKWKTTD